MITEIRLSPPFYENNPTLIVPMLHLPTTRETSNGRRKIFLNSVVTLRAVAMAALTVVWMTSCTVAQKGGTPLPTVDMYKADDIIPQNSASPVTSDPDVPSHTPDVDSAADAPLPGTARLRAARGAPQALATRRGTIEKLDVQALIAREFERYDPAYLAHQASREERLDLLKLKLQSSEESGKALPCSRRMMIEAEWLLDYTAEWGKLDRQLTVLEQSLATRDQSFALRQAPDGSWGVCYDAWFQKINGTIDAVGLLPLSADGAPPKLRYSIGILHKSTARAP